MDFLDFLRYFPWSKFAAVPVWIADRLRSWWATTLFWLGFAGLLVGAYLSIKHSPSWATAVSSGAVLVVVALLVGPRRR